MSEKEIIERLIGIIERLLDENERLRESHFIASPTTPLTYPSTTYPGTVPTIWPAPKITYETKGGRMSDLDLPLAVRMMQDGYLMEIQDLKEKNEKLRDLLREILYNCCESIESTCDTCGCYRNMCMADEMARELGVDT